MRTVLLGKPGSGKGTQARQLSQVKRIAAVSTGDLIRHTIKADASRGQAFRAYLDRGLLVPDALVLELVIHRLRQPDCAQGFLLDGFPRTIAQAEALEAMLLERAQPVTCALYIEVPDSVLVERATGRRYCPADGTSYHIKFAPSRFKGVCDQCGGKLVQRTDDVAQVVLARLGEYRDKTAPLLGYYQARGLLRQIDGLGTPQEVSLRLDTVLAAVTP